MPMKWVPVSKRCVYVCFCMCMYMYIAELTGMFTSVYDK